MQVNEGEELKVVGSRPSVWVSVARLLWWGLQLDHVCLKAGMTTDMLWLYMCVGPVRPAW